MLDTLTKQLMFCRAPSQQSIQYQLLCHLGGGSVVCGVCTGMDASRYAALDAAPSKLLANS